MNVDVGDWNDDVAMSDSDDVNDDVGDLNAANIETAFEDLRTIANTKLKKCKKANKIILDRKALESHYIPQVLFLNLLLCYRLMIWSWFARNDKKKDLGHMRALLPSMKC